MNEHEDIVAGFDRPTNGVEALVHIETLVERVLDGDPLEDGRLDAQGLHEALRNVWEIADAGLLAEARKRSNFEEGEL